MDDGAENRMTEQRTEKMKNSYICPKKFWRMTMIEEKIADFFFPWGTYCVCCGNYIDRERSYCLCDHCVEHIDWGKWEIPLNQLKTEWEKEALFQEGSLFPLDSARCCMRYGIYARRLIFELKYNGNTYMARILARIMGDRILTDSAAAELLKADYMIPVPLHKEKLEKRGFNQAEKIGFYLGKFIGIPMLANGLLRKKATVPQRSIAGMERFTNLRDIFEVTPVWEKRISGKRILLLDDIFTTGATAYHCGKALKKAGACRVDFLALASGNTGGETGFSCEDGLEKQGGNS